MKNYQKSRFAACEDPSPLLLLVLVVLLSLSIAVVLSTGNELQRTVARRPAQTATKVVRSTSARITQEQEAAGSLTVAVGNAYAGWTE